RRWFAGDLDPEIRGLQSYVQMGGVGVLRQQRRFNVFRSAILQADRQLVLQRESTVRFLRNGTLYREMRLQPGRYDFASLPLLTGSNDIDIQVQDDTGSIQSHRINSISTRSISIRAITSMGLSWGRRVSGS